MKRNLCRVLFLPANGVALTDAEYVGPIYKRVTDIKWDSLPRWKKLLRKEEDFEVDEPDPINEENLHGSIWKAMEYAAQSGYEVMLYPPKYSEVITEVFDPAFAKLRSKGIDFKVLHENSVEAFGQAIKEFNVSLCNSIFVFSDFESFAKLYADYSGANDSQANDVAGLNAIFWDLAREHDRNSYFINSCRRNNQMLHSYSTVTEKLPFSLKRIIDSDRLYSRRVFPFLTDKILYIESSFDKAINGFIQSNLRWIREQAIQKGCDFVYFSELPDQAQLKSFVSEYLKYYYPDSPDSLPSKFLEFNEQIPHNEWGKILLELLGLPHDGSPALIRNRGSIANTQPNEFSCIHLAGNKNVKEQFEQYFRSLQRAYSTDRVCCMADSKEYDNKDKDVDSNFSEEANKLAEDVIKKIDYLKNAGMHSLLAEIALRMFDGNGAGIPQQIESNGKTIEIRIDVPQPVCRPLSRVRIEWITRFDFQIVLPDYGTMIVEMPILPKALYYFFLQHPEGVLLNSLIIYYDELLAIYSRLSNISDKDKIQEHIDKLTDPLDNSINVNCSRIKNAFVKLIDDRLAKNYYITGERGKRKKISLPATYIEIIDNHSK